MSGTDAAAAALIPVFDVLNEKLDLGFDHLRIVHDAVERVRVELEVSGMATAFVGTTFSPAGGRPAELYQAGRAWDHGGPIHRLHRTWEVKA